MALLWIIITVCMADSTQGEGCTGGQHCSDCDTAGNCIQDCDIEGNCLQQCDKGYFGLKCKSPCSTKCRYKTCTLAEGRGIGKCTDGCVLGFHGTSCDRPCNSQVVNCTPCSGGCDGDYCQLGGACFAGCRDSFYGAGCKTCPSHCRTCNRMTGVCDECDPTHYGENCEKSCENCAGSCESSCECVPGFYGDFCAETCSKTCRPKSGHKCLPLPGMTSDNCTDECHKHTAKCLHGCVDGWFGPTCSSPCNHGCRHQRCDAAGSCAEGCEPHYFGSACEPCPETCVNQTCDSNNGSGVRRELNCTLDCSPPGCSSGAPNTSLPKWPHISTTTLTSVVCAVVLFALVASSVCCVCFRRGPCIQRASQTDTGTHNTVCEQADAAKYQVLHRYWEITEVEAKLGDEIRNQNYGNSSDANDAAMLVLADYFPGAEDEGTEAGDEGTEARDEGTDAGDEGTEARDEGTDAGDEGTEAGDEGTDAGDEGTDAGDEGTEAGDEGTDAGDEGTDARDADIAVGHSDTEAGDGTSDSSGTDNHSYTHFVPDPRTAITYISPLED